MTSTIDDTIPADNVKVEKADLRSNFTKAKSEITELQRKVRMPYKIAFGELNV